MWNKIKKLLKHWPKTIRIEVRDGDYRLLAIEYVKINNWNQVLRKGSLVAQKVMRLAENENIDEVYWSYKEV